MLPVEGAACLEGFQEFVWIRFGVHFGVFVGMLGFSILERDLKFL